MDICDLYLGTLSSTRILCEVLHVRDLQRNLLSIAWLVDLGVFVRFDHSKCQIEKDGPTVGVAPSRHGHTIGVAPSRHGNLFELSLNDDVANVVTAEGDLHSKSWNYRFIHFVFSKILDIHRLS